MFKIIVTEAVVSKGFNNEPALRFAEGEKPSARFRIGKSVYDTRVEGNYRWININVRAFGRIAERLNGMKLEGGSRLNLIGRYDEDVWEDETTRESKSAPVIILEDVELCYTGNGNGNGSAAGSGNQPKAASNAPSTQSTPTAAAPPPNQQGGGFEGFAPFGAGANPFFSEG